MMVFFLITICNIFFLYGPARCWSHFPAACLGGHSPAGARGAFRNAHEESGGADLLELGLLARVQEDHGESEVKRDPQTVHHLLAQILTEETK